MAAGSVFFLHSVSRSAERARRRSSLPGRRTIRFPARGPALFADGGEPPGRNSHLPAGRSRVRHATADSAGRHMARSARRLAAIAQAREL